MTDVRDPETGTELKLETAPKTVPARQTVVSRALAPIRRVTGLDNRTSAREIDLRAAMPVILEPRPGRAFFFIRWSFILIVCLPTLGFGLYLYFISTDQYQAEARFAVRAADPIVANGGGLDLAAMGAGSDGGDKSAAGGAMGPGAMGGAAGGGSSYLSGATIGGQDAEIVANYIHSRAIIDDISKTLDVRAIFRRPEADFFARLSKDASEEDLLLYWNKMIAVYIETSSGIVTMSASAFRRDDALTLADAIVKSSEKLVNSLSEKVRADAMKTAEAEVLRSDGEVRFALAALTTFRNKNHFIDPVSSAETTSKLLLQLLGDQIQAEAELYVAQRSQGPDAPGIGTLRAKLESINRHVRDLRDQMAGGKQLSDNLAATLSEFEGLELKLKFAERMYGFARDGVERARVQAIRQSVYLSVFVPASLPQEYSYPLRTTDLLLFGFAALMLWVCGLTITASILDHRL